MKSYILCTLIFFSSLLYSNTICTANFSAHNTKTIQNGDRKLSEEEVKRRGFDHLVTEIVENLDEINLRKMARSAIFETSYGFRWKMVNLATGSVIIIKVDKDFNLISARKSNGSKVMNP
ncbi:hypothetical protein [Aquimarina sp. MMG016]|uniref:hypothetical protein n=1 Tax=Aquimarina sp. MMG016 TaxID=2822690 RepID=UPI001B3A6B1A|nr:hypothetical protein [Aquimarina sp. MMG016]MBQ4822764.1 hypothetical protein [Aquimarina sp. MMG016]